jgi:hypothetical protein
MQKGYGIIFVSAVIAMATFLILPCLAQEKKEKEKEKQEKDIWTEEEPRGPREMGEPGGPGRPGRPGGPRELTEPGEPREPRGPRGGPRWFELTDETIEQIMKDLAKSEPAKAAELSKLREKDPEKFKEELGKTATARERFEKVIRERMEARTRQMQAEYIEFLEKTYPKEAEKLAELKERDPNLYIKQFRLSMDKYGRIFRAARENPELGEVLKEDLELKEKEEQLLKKIKSAGKEDEKKELTAQLEKTVGRRFDLLVRQKEIEYGRLLRRLEELKKQLEENKAEVTKWKDAKFKEENVKKRVQELIRGFKPVPWD